MTGFFYHFVMNDEDRIDQDRIVELETKIAFLENSVQELSDVLAEQQKEIQALNKTNKAIIDKLGALISGEEISSEFEKPPHY